MLILTDHVIKYFAKPIDVYFVIYLWLAPVWVKKYHATSLPGNNLTTSLPHSCGKYEAPIGLTNRHMRDFCRQR